MIGQSPEADTNVRTSLDQNRRTGEARVSPIGQPIEGRPMSSGQNAAGNAQDQKVHAEDSPVNDLKSDRKFFEEPDNANPKQSPREALDEKMDKAMTRQALGEIELLKRQNGVFFYHLAPDMTYRLSSRTSLFCLSDSNPVRKGFVWLAWWPGFDNFITVMILLNSIMLASTDYGTRLDPLYESDWTPIQEQIDLGFSIIFIIEFVVKVIAMGFVLHKFSYLRDAWNCLDFFIVVVSIIGFLPMGGGSSGLKALRTFRILRPLRSVNKMPTMKQQISSLLASIPGLMRVFFFIIFIFCIFAIFGVNQFLGQQYQFCRSSEDAIYDADNNFMRWPKSGEDDDSLALCSTDAQCAGLYPDDEVAICGTVFEKFGLDPMVHDDIRNIELIMYGIPSFDNVFWGFLTIFQILTLESWVYLMYNFSDAGSPTISVIFFVLAVLLGAFFTMNLVLAIIVDAFDQNQPGSDSADEEEVEKEKEQLSKELSRSMTKPPSTTQDQNIKIQDNNDQPIESHNVEAPTRNADGLLPEISKRTNELAAQRFGEIERNVNILGSEGSQEEVLQVAQPEGRIGGDLSGIQENIISQEKVDTVQIVNDIDNRATPSRTLASAQDMNKNTANEDLYYLEELEYEKDARIRADQNGVYKCLFELVTSVSFNFFIFVLIIANTITLASYHYNQSDLQTQVLEVFNEFFTWTFFLEMILKIIGLGFQNYRQDKYNVFDSVIVIISLIDWTISRIPNLDAGSALNAFRALRLLRMLKLSKSWKALADILRKTAKSMQEILSFSVLLFLFMYIFALLGMELFANNALIDADDNLVAGEEEIMALVASGDFYTFPRENFNNVGYALSTIFILIIGEDWNWTMYGWVRAYGYGSAVSEYIAIFFFLILMIMGNIVLFSLFTAVLLKNFEGGDEEEEEEDDEDLPKQSFMQKIKSSEFWEDISTGFKEAFGKKKRIPKLLNTEGEEVVINEELRKKEEALRELESDSQASDFHSAAQSASIQNQLDEHERKLREQFKDARRKKRAAKTNKFAKVGSLMHYDTEKTMMQRVSTIKKDVKVELTPLMGKSLFCLGPENGCRNAIYRFVENKWFGNIILILILISTLTLALETPLDDPLGDKIKILGYIDLFMTAVFTFEAVVKIIAFGFAFAGKNSYIREPWNILDFVIVASALLGVIAGDSIKISFIKALRILKILRPLRLIARNKKLKVAIVTLGRSIPNIFRLQVIVLFFVFLFAILQTTILSGSFYRCSTDHLSLSMKQQLANIKTMEDCYNYGGEWVVPDLNFNTVFNSMLTLVTIQTTEGWIDVLWDSVDAVGPYQQPVEGNSPIMIVYTMLLIIIICMLFIELFVGIVIETFNNQKELMAGNSDLERSQRSYIEVHMMAIKSKPKKRLEAQYSKLRNAMIHLTEHRNFDMFIMICIIANTFVLGFNWYMQPQSYKDVLEVFNYTFMVIFTVEAVVKIIAQRKDYFKDSWNIFDFTVVMGTIVILGITWAGMAGGLEILGTILRTLRIGRVFRLIKKQQKLQEIFKTLIDATPAMASLGLLLMLLIFMFAIIGMSQFALVGLDGASEMNRHVNFQSFGASFLTLIRCATGEAWNSIMFDSSQPRSILNQCNETEDYDTIVADGRDPTHFDGPAGCGTGVAVGFHLFFQVIVSQVFLNLFIAIIIDAFFGQTDLANMPVQQKTVEDFQTIWSKYDPDGTGFIAVSSLEKLLLDLSEARPDEGGSLIPFKKRMQKQEFRNRQILFLDIPTYNNMEKVMFYDVLIRLCHQAVKLFYQQNEIKNMQRQLKVLKMMGQGALNDDTLEVVHSKNVKKNRFDREFTALQMKLQEEKPRAELVNELQIENKKLQKKFNHQVDTNIKVVGAEKAQQLVEMDKETDVALYTTAHLGSALQIHDFIVECLEKRRNRGNFRDSRDLNSVPEVSSRQEMTNAQRDENAQRQEEANLAAAQASQPMSGSIEQEPAEDHNDSSQVPDQDWRNLR